MNKIINSDTKSYGEFHKKIIETSEPTLMPTVTFYEGVGTLVKENLLDIRLVALSVGGWMLKFWEKITPYIKQMRKEFEYPRFASETEYLCNRLKEYFDSHPEMREPQ